MPGLTLRHLFKTYQGRHQESQGVAAVKDLNLEVHDQESLALLGPSGCGKSSTLRMIAGLEQVSGGEIYIGDRLVNDLDPRERNIAMAFETYALYPTFTVRENLAFPLHVRKLGAPEITEKVNRVAEMLNITDILDRKPKELSGGQQQCVSLGRALIRNPDLFLLDEPLSHVDTDQRVRLRTELRRLQQTIKVTTIYVTHDQLEAAALADRIAVMNLGELQQVGTIFDLYDRPANDFVANFIGEPATNFEECDVVRTDEHLALRACNGSFTTTLLPQHGQVLEARSVSKVKMGIRPMSIDVSLSDTAGAIPGSVYIFELLGEEAVLTAEVGSARFRTLVNPSLQATIGQNCWLSFNPEKLHAFDLTTGVAIF
jgi:multiple sugar transport system ATP-binding protein